MGLIEDWKIYWEDEASFDRFHFRNLLIDSRSEPELEEILNGLPGYKGTISRLIHLYENSRIGGFDYRLPRQEKMIEQHQALALTREISVEQKEHLIALSCDDLAEELDGLQVVMASIEQVKAAMSDEENLAFGISDEVSDDYVGQPFQPRHVFSGLYEAALALTTYPEVTRYLLDPIWPYSLKYDKEYDLYLGGYVYFVTNSEVLLAKNAP